MDAGFYWDLIITLESRKEELEPKLSGVTMSEFEEYTLIQELLGPLYKAVPNLKE